jgi:hypothetical protein
VHVAGHSDAVAEHAFAVKLAVMPHVAVGHNEIEIAYDRTFGRFKSAVDDYMLTNHIVIADDAMSLSSFPSEILRVGTDHGSLIHFVSAAHTRTVHDTRVWHYLAAVTYDYIFIYIGKRVDCDVLAYPGRGIDMS